MNNSDIIAALLWGQGSRTDKVRTLKEHGPEALLDMVSPPSLFGREELPRSAAEELLRQGPAVVTSISPNYPHLLTLSDDDPGLLFVTGTLVPDEPTVAIVGSRHAAGKDLDFARDLARAFARTGVCVASGLASGIDTAAHRGALQAGGRTIAVMGTGPDITFPEHNARLRQRIERCGATITQFPPGQEGTTYTFPRRNVTMAALSHATVIVAAEESSGTKHQARAALDNGRSLIMTPQVAQRTWAKKLLTHSNTHVASTVAEILDTFWTLSAKKASSPSGKNPLSWPQVS